MEDSMPQPMVEMSQDCIEWDESKNVDLRQIARSPNETSISLYVTSCSTTKPQSTGSLETVKRKLVQTEMVDSLETSNKALRTQPGMFKNSEKQAKQKQSEQEIDGILSTLQKEEEQMAPEERLQSVSSALPLADNVPTQRQGHRANTSRAAAVFPSPKPITSLAARHRRRRRDMENLNPNNPKRLHILPLPRSRDKKYMSRNDRNLRSPDPAGSVSSLPTGGGDFEALLKQMTTPQSAPMKQRVPLRDLGGNGCDEAGSNLPDSFDVSDVPLSPNRLGTETSIIQQNQSSLHIEKHHPTEKPISAFQLESKNLKSINDSKNVSDLTGSIVSVATNCRSDSLPQVACQDRRNDLNLLKPKKQIPKERLKHRALSPLRQSNQNRETSNQNEDDDEFGDLDLSADDFANIDSLLSAKCSQEQSQVFKSDSEPVGRNDQSHQKIKFQKPDVFTDTLQESGDEFGEFPDIDFDAMDKVIENRSKLSGSSLTSMDKKVCNRKSSLDLADVSFLTFTRYKVLSVDDDVTTYTKSVSVATWKPSMLENGKKSKLPIKHMTTETGFGGVKGHLSVIPTNDGSNSGDGFLFLRDEWYHTRVSSGDVLHVCSLSGRYRTGADALPITLRSTPLPGNDVDDLVLIVHPDVLATPTTVSETVGCSRRAVLKSRLGSTGLSSKAALFGTMRHELFGVCFKENNFTGPFAHLNVKKIIRRNAEGLIGCDTSAEEAEREVLSAFPNIQRFAAKYTTLSGGDEKAKNHPHALLEGHGGYPLVHFQAKTAVAIEEPIISPELGLKGNADLIVEAETAPLDSNVVHPPHNRVSSARNSIMCLELKTGHNQKTQPTHMAQLALYTVMLQVKHGVNMQPLKMCSEDTRIKGAANGGVLLYLNQESMRSVHVAPLLNEIKSLIGQRNLAVTEQIRASRPRGVLLDYSEEETADEKDDLAIKLLPAPPATLPETLPNAHSCKRCFANRECMMYAAAELPSKPMSVNFGAEHSHKDLLARFTGHLKNEDLTYFREWDRLIDLEAHANSNNVAEAWLQDSGHREKETGESISSLIFDGTEPGPEIVPYILLCFRRAPASALKTPLSKVGFANGSQLIIGTDATSFDSSPPPTSLKPSPRERAMQPRRIFRHQMHVVRATMEATEGDRLLVRASRDDLTRIQELARRYKEQHYKSLLFRFDKDNTSMGITTLRQNLINFFTSDAAQNEGNEKQIRTMSLGQRLSWLRDVVVRLKPPVFDEAASNSLFTSSSPTNQVPGCNLKALTIEYANLNPDQKAAVQKVICAKDYALIQGFPGTGKTSTLAFVARVLAARGKRVLITSYTHNAVDNVAMKLMQHGLGSVNRKTGLPPLVRVGRRSTCHTHVLPILVSELAIARDRSKDTPSGDPADHQDLPSARSMLDVMAAARIICTSALSVPRSSLLSGENFDVVIVDEAGQISQPAILGVLAAADSFVLVGDHLQLPPLVKSEIAQLGGFGVSLFERLASKFPDSITPLTYQYRMHADICRLSSEFVYGGMLKCANDKVSSSLLPLSGFPSKLPPPISRTVYQWLPAVIDPLKTVVFVDTDNIKTKTSISNGETSCLRRKPCTEGMEPLERNMGGRAGGSVVNHTEATLVRFIVQGLVSTGLPVSSIGIICPFRAQIRILDDNALIKKWKDDGLELSTIDRYQGRDKLAIIVSFVRSNSKGKAGRLLQDSRRLNVAMTRAKCKLILVGSFSTLQNGSRSLKPLLDRINERGQRFLLPDNGAECYKIT